MSRTVDLEPCTHVEVLVEEPSMEAALRVLLPQILGPISFSVYQHQSKAALLARLPARLRGYARSLQPGQRILVIVDRDRDDAAALRERLDGMAAAAGFGAERPLVLNRLAVEELEAWYFGDWAAVRRAYPKAPATIPQQAAYRQPDEIKGGTWEAFQRVLQEAGYFTGGLRKIEAARAVAEHMKPAHNTSPSFRELRATLAALSGAAGRSRTSV